MTNSVPSNFLANRLVAKFPQNNNAISCKNIYYIDIELCTNLILKNTKIKVIFPQICGHFESYVYHIAKNYLSLVQQIGDAQTTIGVVGTLTD